MPLREYEPDGEECCPECLGGFEILQKMDEPPLERCPECGAPCHQVLSTFRCGGSPKSVLSPANLERQGFTQYVKKGDGYYEKTAGKGPRAIADTQR